MTPFHSDCRWRWHGAESTRRSVDCRPMPVSRTRYSRRYVAGRVRRIPRDFHRALSRIPPGLNSFKPCPVFLFCFLPSLKGFLVFLIQARPDDYPPELLQTQFVVSFHKHWMIDPLLVYEKWFADEDDWSIKSPVDEAGNQQPDCSVMDPSRNCHHVKQQPAAAAAAAQLFQTAKNSGLKERIPDEL